AAVAASIWLLMVKDGVGGEPAVTSREVRSEPRTPTEDRVRRYVQKEAADRGKTRFLAWGPHMTRREFFAAWAAYDERPPLESVHAVVRVQFHGPNIFAWPFQEAEYKQVKDQDAIFFVTGKTIVCAQENRHGDDWKKEYREYVGRLFPSTFP